MVPPEDIVPAKPLADAKARLDASRKRPPKISPDLVIGMKAAGIPHTKIAQVLHTTHPKIHAALNTVPNARERIIELREALKLVKITRAHEIAGKMWSRLEKEVDDGVAKDVDAMARSLLAVEKIEAGVSGEGAASGAPPPVPQVDLKVLIQNLLSS